jgi:hypothetical protein
LEIKGEDFHLTFQYNVPILTSRGPREACKALTMRLTIIEYTLKPAVGGAAMGEALFSRLMASTTGVAKDEVLFLDFDKMELATSSFLRTGILAFRDFCVANNRGVVALANLNREIQEELKDLLLARRDAIATCVLTRNETIESPRIIGELDDKQAIALDALLAGYTDTGAMHREFSSKDSVSLAAWSNRLSALASKGLVIEVSKGRAKTYRPILEGLTYGN